MFYSSDVPASKVPFAFKLFIHIIFPKYKEFNDSKVHFSTTLSFHNMLLYIIYTKNIPLKYYYFALFLIAI